MQRFDIHLKRSPVELFQGSVSVASTVLRPARETASASGSSAAPLPVDPVPAEPRAKSISEADSDHLTGLLSQISEDVLELQNQHRRSMDELQHAAVQLAVAAASWLTGVAISQDQFAVDDLIRKALAQLGADEPVRVRLNPRDHALLNVLLKETPNVGMLDQISLADDESLSRGSCRIESGRRTLITDVETRLEQIHRTWMENLDATQVERRGDGTGGRTLRRFPERRETA